MLPCPLASSHFPGVLGAHSGPLSHRLQPLTDLTGKPVCVVRDELSLATSPQATLLSRYLIRMPTISVPVGDPQSNRDPRLYSGGYWGPLPWGCTWPQGLPGLGRCPRRKRPWLLGGWGSEVLRNVPLLGSEVPEESEKAEDKQIWATDM